MLASSKFHFLHERGGQPPDVGDEELLGLLLLHILELQLTKPDHMYDCTLIFPVSHLNKFIFPNWIIKGYS